MNSIKIFFSYINFSHKELFHFFKEYRLSLLGFFIINLTTLIDWNSSAFVSYATFETPLSFIIVLLNMYLVVNILMIDKSKFLKKKKDYAFYDYPSFVMYTLYSGLIVIVIPFLIIGSDRAMGFNSTISMVIAILFAFFMSVIVSMSPLAAVLIENDHENYFKVSLKIARNSFGVLVMYTILTLLSEAPDLAVGLIEKPLLKTVFGVLHALWDSYVLILVAKVGAKIFYGLFRKQTPVYLVE